MLVLFFVLFVFSDDHHPRCWSQLNWNIIKMDDVWAHTIMHLIVLVVLINLHHLHLHCPDDCTCLVYLYGLWGESGVLDWVKQCRQGSVKKRVSSRPPRILLLIWPISVSSLIYHHHHYHHHSFLYFWDCLMAQCTWLLEVHYCSFIAITDAAGLWCVFVFGYF